MYDTMRKAFYQSHMTSNVSSIAYDGRFCAQNVTNGEKKIQLNLVFFISPLKYIGMDIQSPLNMTFNCSLFTEEMTDGYTELSKTIPTLSTIIITVAHVFFEHRVERSHNSCSLLPENDPQYKLEFVVAFFGTSRLNIITTAKYSR